MRSCCVAALLGSSLIGCSGLEAPSLAHLSAPRATAVDRHTALPSANALERAFDAPAVDLPLAPLVAVTAADCMSPRVSIEVPKVSSSITCKDGWRDCEGTIPVTVENCLTVELRIDEVTLERTSVIGERVAAFDIEKSAPWPPVGAGERMTRLVSVTYGGTYAPQLHASTTSDHYRLEGDEGKLDNPAYLAAVAACDACNGDWGSHGMLGRAGCVCRAKDGGKVCRDGDECEAGCVYNHAEKLGPGVGRRVGKCSESVGGFGCVSYIERGESKLPPRPLAEVESPTNSQCAD